MLRCLYGDVNYLYRETTTLQDRTDANKCPWDWDKTDANKHTWDCLGSNMLILTKPVCVSIEKKASDFSFIF